MLTCEQFEYHLAASHHASPAPEMASSMREHAVLCSHCAALGRETAKLMGMLAQAPRWQPSPGFEFRLERRLRTRLHTQPRLRTVRVLPKWVAVGAGLATGFAVMFALVLPNTGLDTGGGGPANRAPEMTAEKTASALPIDSLRSKRDSVGAPESSYDSDRHSQVVSGGR